MKSQYFGFSCDTLWRAQLGQCFHCGEQMDRIPWRKRHKNGWTREHVVPKSRGGKQARNIVLAHKVCNSNRGNRMPTALEVQRAETIWERAAILPRESKEQSYGEWKQQFSLTGENDASHDG